MTLSFRASPTQTVGWLRSVRHPVPSAPVHRPLRWTLKSAQITISTNHYVTRMATNSSQVDFMTFYYALHTRIATGEAGCLHGVWASRSPVTALVVVHTPNISRVLDIPSPSSASSFWVRVMVSVRRCYRLSGLYALHLSGDVAVGICRPRIAVLIAYTATVSSTLQLRCCNVLPTGGATSARKAHMRIALADAVREESDPVCWF